MYIAAIKSVSLCIYGLVRLHLKKRWGRRHGSSTLDGY